MDTTRQKAWDVLTGHVKEPVLLNHCQAVETPVRAYAEKFGEDVEYWALIWTNILHL